MSIATAADRVKACGARLADARLQVQQLEDHARELATRAPVFDDQDLQRSRRAYEDAAAAHELGKAGAEDLKLARAAVDKAEVAYRQAEAERGRIAAAGAGMQRKLLSARAVVSEHERELQQALRAWGRSEIEAAERVYLEHALLVAEARVRVESLRYWLLDNGVRLPGPAPWADNFHLPALGPLGAATALTYWPRSKNYSGYLDGYVFPAVDRLAAHEALLREVEEMRQPAETGAAAAGLAR